VKRLISQGTITAFAIGEATSVTRGGAAPGLKEAVAAYRRNSAKFSADEMFVERVAKALRFDGCDASEDEREETWAKLKDGTREYWRDFVRLVLREITAAQAGNGEPAAP
jgi:hypothetical protein